MKTVLHFMSIFLLLGFISCNNDKDSNAGINTSLIDAVSVNRYYPSEIILPLYAGMYNKWKLTHVTGGFIGGEHALNFDYLIFKPNGIYCIIRNDSTKEFGQVNVLEQSDERLKISLTPDKSSATFLGDSEKYIDLTHRDTLRMNAPCCDRFNYEYIKLK